MDARMQQNENIFQLNRFSESFCQAIVLAAPLETKHETNTD